MKRVLFVDDESKILDGIRRMLHADRKRWDMQFAVGGEAALQACEAGSFDVVISDMRMPGMDGATLLNHIRDQFCCAISHAGEHKCAMFEAEEEILGTSHAEIGAVPARIMGHPKLGCRGHCASSPSHSHTALRF